MLLGEEKDSAGYPLRFFNPAIGEHYSLPVEWPLAAFWLPDGTAFGFLLMEVPPTDSAVWWTFEMLYLVDASTGDVTRYPIGPTNIWFSRYLFPSEGGTYLGPSIVSASSNDPGSEDFFLFQGGFGISPDLRYLSGPHTTVEFVATSSYVGQLLELGTEVVLTDPDDEWLDLNRLWSPVAPHLMVVQDTQTPDPTTFRSPCQCRLVIYDVQTGEQIASYEGNFTDVAWSPDGTRVLYIRPDTENTRGGDLCILTLSNEQSECVDDGRAQLGWDMIASVRWMRDGNRISYLLFTDDPASPRHATGALCILDLSSRDVTCPTTLVQPEMPWVGQYSFSPDARYLWFQNGCLLCYEGLSMEERILMAVNGSIRWVLHGRYISSAWRPPITER